MNCIFKHNLWKLWNKEDFKWGKSHYCAVVYDYVRPQKTKSNLNK